MPRDVQDKLDEQWGNAIVASHENTTSGWDQFGRWWVDSFLPGFFLTLASVAAFLFGVIKFMSWDSWQMQRV